jgi:hypothetical protein
MAARKNRTPPKATTNGALWRVAVHEAAHAVAAHALGIPLGSVTIAPGATTDGDGYAGRTELRQSPREIQRAVDENCDVEEDSDEGSREKKRLTFCIANMQVSFAGMVAEELFFGAADESGLAGDYDAINSCAEVVCQPDPQELDEKKLDAPPGATYEECLNLAREKVKSLSKWEEDYFKDWVQHRTRKLLRNRRHVVEALARSLLAEKTLSATSISAVIIESLHAPQRGAW